MHALMTDIEYVWRHLFVRLFSFLTLSMNSNRLKWYIFRKLRLTDIFERAQLI